jgi:hypothetical protein
MDKKKLAAIFLLTDGHLSRQKHTWQIGFTNNSKLLRSKFMQLMKELGIKKFRLSRSKAGVPTIRCHSKKIGDQLIALTNSFRTKACTSYPACGKINKKHQGSCKYCNPVIYNHKAYPRIYLNEVFAGLTEK